MTGWVSISVRESSQASSCVNGRKKLKRPNQNGKQVDFDYPCQSHGGNTPAGVKMEPCQSIVIRAKRGKPFWHSERRSLTVRKDGCLEGKGIRRKRMPNCNGSDRAIPTLKSGRLPDGLWRKNCEKELNHGER